MGDEYQLLVESGAKEDSRQILSILEQLRKGTLVNDLRLLNYFNEVLVSYPAIVENVEDDMVDMAVHQNQAVVMNHQKMTFLKSRHFPHDVVAKVFRSDVNKCLAIITRFSYAQIRAERRQFVRVRLDSLIRALFRCDMGEITGTIDDISIGGMCLRASQASELETQARGTLTLALDDSPLEIPAVLLKSKQEDEDFLYVFECETDTKIETKIAQFIFQRQLEIIRELKDHVL